MKTLCQRLFRVKEIKEYYPENRFKPKELLLQDVESGTYYLCTFKEDELIDPIHYYKVGDIIVASLNLIIEPRCLTENLEDTTKVYRFI